MVERSECSRWSNAYFVSFDHKEQFARIDNFLVNKKKIINTFMRVIFTVRSEIRG